MGILLILLFLPLSAQQSLMLEYQFFNNTSPKYITEFQVHNLQGPKISEQQKALLFSAILPGAGQIYNRSPWWKSTMFISVEAAALTACKKWDKSGEDYRVMFEAYADDHWTIENWYFTSMKIFPENWQDILIGTHHLTLKIGGNYFSSDQLTELLQIYSWSEIKVIRDRDFYENIGKYDQFVGGWDDPFDSPFDADGNWYTEKKGNSEETVILTIQKDKYRGIRHRSNLFKSQVKYALTVLMFNHLISGMEAYWTASSKQSKKRKKIQIELVPDFSYSPTLRGVRINFRW